MNEIPSSPTGYPYEDFHMEREPLVSNTRPKALRGAILFWSLFLGIIYVSYVNFSSTLMSNGKSQFQRVSQSMTRDPNF